MEILGDLTITSDAKIMLKNGAKAENIFWAVHENISLLGSAHAEGIMTSQKTVSFDPGSSLNGAIYAKIGVNLYGNNVIKNVGGVLAAGVGLPVGLPDGSSDGTHSPTFLITLLPYKLTPIFA